MPVKWKGNGTIWELSLVKPQAMKAGTMRKSLSIPLILQETVANFKPNKLYPYSFFLCKIQKSTFIFRRLENYPANRMSCVEEFWLNFIIKIQKVFKMNQVYSEYKQYSSPEGRQKTILFKDSLISNKLPGRFIWDELKRGWVMRKDFFWVVSRKESLFLQLS